jgi:hypothetical protein
MARLKPIWSCVMMTEMTLERLRAHRNNIHRYQRAARNPSFGCGAGGISSVDWRKSALASKLFCSRRFRTASPHELERSETRTKP